MCGWRKSVFRCGNYVVSTGVCVCVCVCARMYMLYLSDDFIHQKDEDASDEDEMDSEDYQPSDDEEDAPDESDSDEDYTDISENSDEEEGVCRRSFLASCLYSHS